MEKSMFSTEAIILSKRRNRLADDHLVKAFASETK